VRGSMSLSLTKKWRVSYQTSQPVPDDNALKIVARGAPTKKLMRFRRLPRSQEFGMAKGYIIIFEGKGPLFEERHPSAVVHKTRDEAEAAWKRGDQVGRPLQIIEIDWDDTGTKMPWPLQRPDWLSLPSLQIVGGDIWRAKADGCISAGGSGPWGSGPLRASLVFDRPKHRRNQVGILPPPIAFNSPV
jgi:hypothetical protein